MDSTRKRNAGWAARVCVLVTLGITSASAQAPDEAAIIRGIDSAVALRMNSVLGFTDTEHYAVFRGADETHPVAEMTVKDTYTKGVGKNYTILSQSGSAIIQKFGLRALLNNEKQINLPGNVEKSWFFSANYEMKLKPGGVAQLNGRDCYVLAIAARHKAPNTINGTLWVDARDGSIVQIDGMATASASVFSGPAHMMRQYGNVNGFAMATHARAESASTLFGQTVVTIGYSNYQLHIRGNN
jgi:hypothetical protein